MKKTFLIALVAAVVAGGVFAKEISMAPFAPRSPVVMAQGGSYTAVASGYDSLFSNPAGFASPKGSLTIASAMPWVYGNPKELGDASDTLDTSQGISDYMEAASKNGVGAGTSAGIAYVGRGLGLGFIVSSDLFLAGNPFPAGIKGYTSNDISLIGGLALSPINLSNFKLSVGADLRPTIRVFAPLTAEGALEVLDNMNDTDAMNSIDVYQGAGLGIDLGAKLALGDFTVALTFRDLFGTRYAMTTYGLGDWLDAAQAAGGLPESGTESSDTYIVPMNIILGGAYHPDLGGLSFFFDPTIHADIADPIGVFRDNKSPWSLLHIGTEVKVFRFIKLRGGINQGYITAGAGVRLLFLDLNIAAFTRELGRYAGDNASSGMSAEIALRF